MSAESARSPWLPRPTRRSALTRERILEAATEIFARRGLHGARIADIAEAAGIAYGLVYHHFRNKEEILAAIFNERWAGYIAYLDELRTTPATFRERIARLVHYWVETWRHDPQLMTVMINEITRSHEFAEKHVLDTVNAAFQGVERLLDDAREHGELRSEVDCRLVAYAILGVAEMVLTGYVMRTLPRSGREDYARDEQQLVSLLLDGLAAS